MKIIISCSVKQNILYKKKTDGVSLLFLILTHSAFPQEMLPIPMHVSETSLQNNITFSGYIVLILPVIRQTMVKLSI